MGQTTVIVVANQKGGVGKTSLCQNLAGGLASRGRRVLLIDLDPQANLSASFTLDGGGRVADVFDGQIPEPAATDCPLIHLLAADRNLSGVLPALMADFSLQFALGDYLRRLPLEVDVVVIDTPPTMGSFATAGLLAATHLLIPLSTQFFSMQGTRDLMASVEKVRSRLNQGLTLLGAVVAVCDTRSALAGEVLAKSREFFGEHLLAATVGRSVKVEEAQVARKPLSLAFPTSSAAVQYQAVADEVLTRLGLSGVVVGGGQAMGATGSTGVAG